MVDESIKTQVLLEIAVQQSHEGSINDIINKMLPLYMRKLNCFFAGIISMTKPSIVIPYAFKNDELWKCINSDLMNKISAKQDDILDFEYENAYVYSYKLTDSEYFIIGKKLPFSKPIKFELKNVIKQLGRTLIQAEKEESIKIFQNVMGFSTDAVHVTTEDGRFFYINNVATELLELENIEVSNHYIYEIEDYFKGKNTWLEFISTLKKYGNSLIEYSKINKKTGKLISLEVSSKFVEIAEKGFVLAISRDITSRKESIYALEKALVDAEKANKAKSEFLANMSHEIRTPMNAILGFSEIITNNDNLNKNKEYALTINKSAKNLLKIINDILDLSKIESGKFEITYESISIRTIISEIAQIFEPKMAYKGLTLNIDIDSNLPEMIYFDDTRFRQILFNMIGNAVKFTAEGYIEITAKLISKNEDEIDLLVVIKDTGIGIPEEYLDKIFESFSQVNSSITRNFEGTGLGLAITKRLVNLLNGRINVESQYGFGSTFILEFNKLKISNEGANYTESLINYDNIKFVSSKILIVDDIIHNQELLKIFLSSQDFEFYIANNGYEALSLFNNNNFDLVFMDLRMPQLDGFETTEKIRQMINTKKVPIIAFTASAMQSDEERIAQLFDYYLRKPVTKNELFNCITKFIKYEESSTSTNDYMPPINIDFEFQPEEIQKIRSDFETKFKSRFTEIKSFFDAEIINDAIRDFKDFCRESNINFFDSCILKIETAAENYDVELLSYCWDYIIKTFDANLPAKKIS